MCVLCACLCVKKREPRICLALYMELILIERVRESVRACACLCVKEREPRICLALYLELILVERVREIVRVCVCKRESLASAPLFTWN